MQDNKTKAPGASIKNEQRKMGWLKLLGKLLNRAVERGRYRKEVRTEAVLLRLAAMQARGEQKRDGCKFLSLPRW